MNMQRSIYSNSARFDKTRVLTDDDMRLIAPSIFAEEAHDSRSERFQPIPTIEVLNGLRKEGFMPVAVKQSRTRDESRRDFTKHMIRLRRVDDGKQYQVGDNIFEILLKNANDGTSAYEIMAGMFRIACLNSLVTPVGEHESCKVRHSGDVTNKVIEGTYSVLDQSQLALEAPVKWSGINLEPEEKMILAQGVHELRFDDPENAPIKPATMLIPRRPSDREDNLWTTMNVVQENAIRGGLHGVRFDENNRRRRTTTREVKGIDQSVKINRAIWLLSQRMAELKAAA